MVNKRRSKARSGRGQGIVEGVVGLVIVIGGGVLASLLLVNTGVSAFYKERIGYVTQKAADFAAIKYGNEGAESATKAFTSDLLKASGLPDLGDFSIEKISVGGQDAVRVNVTVAGLVLFGSGDVLPKTISLQDHAVSPMMTAGGGNGDGILQIVVGGGTFAYAVPAKQIALGTEAGLNDTSGFARLKEKINFNAPTMTIITDPDAYSRVGIDHNGFSKGVNVK